jgi:hypothetical protein
MPMLVFRATLERVVRGTARKEKEKVVTAKVAKACVTRCVTQANASSEPNAVSAMIPRTLAEHLLESTRLLKSKSKIKKP